MAERVVPFLKYPGGKRWLARRIIERLPEHVCYVEEVRRIRTINQATRREYVELIITP
ncbi:MAG: hypothetical protein WHS90_20880 [Caldilinea sp.]|uniref:hypothetical protein n=1 Tax=Caldilinea sp. TaxID=2293560 RepID=UPI00309AACE9